MRFPSLLIVIAGCSHQAPRSGIAPAEPPPDERWETVIDRKLASPERCGVGPYELVLPLRDDEWGRRVVFQVYSPRKLLIDTSVAGGGSWGRVGSWQTGFSVYTDRVDGDHARCRIASGDTVIATAPAHGGTSAPPTASHPHSPAGRAWTTTATADLPALVEPTAPPSAPLVERHALAWLPQGDPWYYADELWTTRMVNREGASEIRIRFWLEQPSDLDGVVFEILDQRLVPNLPIATYLPRFRARVADADAKREAAKPPPPACPSCRQQELNALVARCQTEHDAAECHFLHARNGQQPPPPRPEVQPASPGSGVEWITGYWQWSEELDDFVWIGGTYVVRAPDPVVAAKPEPPAPGPKTAPPPATPAPPATVSADEPVEPAREVKVEEPPAPRVETITAPPTQIGVLWVAGHWQLVGTTWRWTAGRWVQPPPGGARFQPPALHVHGSARVYVPGRWIRVR